MNTALAELYHLLAPQFRSEEEKQILEQNKAAIDLIERQLPEKDLSSFMEVQAGLSLRREEAAFALGFQLAARIFAPAEQ